MLLWILSDLHVELTRGWDPPTDDARLQFDVMFVAGDLIPRAERGVRWLLERVQDRPVVYVMGNHEAYGTDIQRTLEKAKAAAAGANVHVLENETVRIGDVTFAGATLWTDFALNGDAYRAMMVAADRMNDYKKVRIAAYRRRFLPHHGLTRHLKSRAFLEAEMRKPRSGKLVVVSHHAPHPSAARTLPDPPTPDEILSAAYRSDLTALMRPTSDDGPGAPNPVDLWINGHTHESEDTVIGATRIVSNAKGYGPWPPQQRGWDNPHLTWTWPRWIPLDESARGFSRFEWLERELKKSKFSTLLVWGREDEVFDHNTFATRFKELLPHAEGRELVTGRHFLQEDSGAEIAERINRFLDRIDGRQS